MEKNKGLKYTDADVVMDDYIKPQGFDLQDVSYWNFYKTWYNN